jgi:hypothetical protein
MAPASDEICVSIADLNLEIKAIMQSVEASETRLKESLARAEDAVAKLECEANRQSASPNATEALAEKLEMARRNATRIQQEGEAKLKAFRKKTDGALDKLRRRLKLVEEKLSAR